MHYSHGNINAIKKSLKSHLRKIISKQMVELNNYALLGLFLRKQQPLTLWWKLLRRWRTYGRAEKREQLGQNCRGTQLSGPRLISPNETSMKHFVLSSTLGNLVSLPCRMNIPEQYQSPRRTGAGAEAAVCKYTDKVKRPQCEVNWPLTLGIGCIYLQHLSKKVHRNMAQMNGRCLEYILGSHQK